MTTGSADRRGAIFERIRAGVADGAPISARKAAVTARLAGQKPHLVPERANLGQAGLEALFTQYLQGQSATVVELADASDAPTVIAGYLRSQNQPMRVRFGNDPRLANLPWEREPAMTLESGPTRSSFEVALSHAVAGVAETGTLVMVSGADNPVTLNYLPETHIVIIRAQDIVGSYETSIERLREKLGRGTMPRTLNLISGPSRSADIGGRPVLGAHGPRRLCVLVVRG